MSDEKMRILRMLENGKISAEEAEKLLKALSEDSGKGPGFIERIIGEVVTGEEFRGTYKEHFSAKSAELKLRGASLELKKSKDEEYHISGHGYIRVKDIDDEAEIKITGSATLEVPENGELSVNIKASDLKGEIITPIDIESKMSNIELRVCKSLKIDIEMKMGNLVLNFESPVNQKFSVEQNLGNLESDFKLEKSGDKMIGEEGENGEKVTVKSKLSNIEIRKKEEV